MSFFDAKIEGFEGLIRKLTDLKVDRATENKALRKGAKVTQEAIIQEAPGIPGGRNKGRSKGRIKSNIKIKAEDGEMIIHSGRAGHAVIIEGGRMQGRRRTRKGKKQQLVRWGPLPADPFFSRGYESSKEEALKAIGEAIRKEMKL